MLEGITGPGRRRREMVKPLTRFGAPGWGLNVRPGLAATLKKMLYSATLS